MQTYKTSQKKSAAFTLLELLIVVGIIGILMVALLTVGADVPAKARDVQRKQDIQTVYQAIEAYRIRHGMYPAMVSGKCLANTGDLATMADEYLNGILPRDPSDNATLNCGTSYYFYRSQGNSFVIMAHLETPGTGNVANDTETGGATGSRPRDWILGDTTWDGTDTSTMVILKNSIAAVAGGTHIAGDFYVLQGGIWNKP